MFVKDGDGFRGSVLVQGDKETGHSVGIIQWYSGTVVQ